MVGVAIGTRLVELGHAVCMGSRQAGNEKAVEWVRSVGEGGPGAASEGTFADAAAHGDLLFNCTSGGASLTALEAAGSENLSGKTLVDVANPLDFSQGMPPRLSVVNDDSLGEQIQAAFPETQVVKSLNTMNCQVMVDPSRIPGEHNVFMSGDDDQAKQRVAGLLGEFGWPAGRVIDLGGIRSCRGTEMFLPLWLSLMGTIGNGDFNIAVVKP
jgi:predicted dinucleotide-binding enzyme